MKKLHFKTTKGEFVIVEDDGNFPKDFPHGIYEKIGYLETITEDQAKEIVDTAIDACEHLTGYSNYTKKNWTDKPFLYETALQSLYSLLESIGVLWEEDLCKDEIEKELGIFGHDIGLTEPDFKDYCRDNKNVFNKSRTYLFRKNDISRKTS